MSNKIIQITIIKIIKIFLSILENIAIEKYKLILLMVGAEGIGKLPEGIASSLASSSQFGESRFAGRPLS